MNKAALRKQYLSERKKLGEDLVTRKSLEISCRFADWIVSYPQWQLIRNVHCFLPIRKQKEVNTSFIIDHLRRQYPHIQIILPKSNPDNHTLNHVVWNESLSLVENNLGIPEPQSGELLPTDRIDIVLVPLLVFDQTGHRVGYGKGYYDHFLAQCLPQTLKIGLSFFAPVSSISDVSVWDVQLNYCVTPEKIWKFN